MSDALGCRQKRAVIAGRSAAKDKCKNKPADQPWPAASARCKRSREDVSPGGDGSLLKRVLKPGKESGPQALTTPSPLCEITMRVREEKRGDANKCGMAAAAPRR